MNFKLAKWLADRVGEAARRRGLKASQWVEDALVERLEKEEFRGGTRTPFALPDQAVPDEERCFGLAVGDVVEVLSPSKSLKLFAESSRPHARVMGFTRKRVRVEVLSPDGPGPPGTWDPQRLKKVEGRDAEN
jgi:hypothetical protein